MLPFHKELFVWVLAPFVETNDANLDYYYDYTQSIEEFTIAFKELNIKWQWQPVTNSDFKAIIDLIIAGPNPENVVVINLCDGDEINNAPGVNVIRYLKKSGLCFTGSDEYFYRTTTSKIIMKQVFEARNVDKCQNSAQGAVMVDIDLFDQNSMIADLHKVHSIDRHI